METEQRKKDSLRNLQQQMEALSATHIPEERNGSLNLLRVTGDIYRHFLHTRIRENILLSVLKVDF